MNNLFSVFDPSVSNPVINNWVSIFVIMIIVPCKFWPGKNKSHGLFIFGLKSIYLEINSVFGSASSRPGTAFIFISLFLFIGLSNLFSMLPYVFTPTSHLSMTLSLALPLWLGHVAFSFKVNPNGFFSHLVPLGTPVSLMSFMVIIELISALIRPVTLSVRLAANLVAGHLLLTLLGTAGNLGENFMVIIIVFSCILLLLILELGVALIQAYVFSLLSSLYVNEVSPNTIV